jgi:hypothetical protein
MRFVYDALPLLVVVHAARFDESEMREMVAGYEGCFSRNERYAVLTVAPNLFVHLGAAERKLISDWVNQPHVREASKRLCVGSATVAPSAVARGAMTAICWFWTPPLPFHMVSTVEEGIDFCAERLREQNMTLPRPIASVRLEIVGLLRKVGGFEPSLRQEAPQRRW